MDNFQAQAMRGLLTSMNLTYIAMFYSASAYGIGLKDMLTEYKRKYPWGPFVGSMFGVLKCAQIV